QDRVKGCKAAGPALRQHSFASQNAMALKKGAGGSVKALGGAWIGTPEVGDQRPAAGRPRLGELGQAGPAALAAFRGRSQQAQRRVGVVRDLARPDQVPERVQHSLLVSAAGRGVEVAEEAGALPLQEASNLGVDLAGRWL